MTIAYWIITIMLSLVWLIILVGGPFIAAVEPEAGEAFKVYAAVVAGATIVVLAWPVLLCLAFPVLFVYGCYQGIKMLVKKPWRN